MIYQLWCAHINQYMVAMDLPYPPERRMKALYDEGIELDKAKSILTEEWKRGEW